MLRPLVYANIYKCSISSLTSGYATWFTAGGAIRIAHYDVIDDIITRKLQEIEKNGDHLPHEIV